MHTTCDVVYLSILDFGFSIGRERFDIGPKDGDDTYSVHSLWWCYNFDGIWFISLSYVLTIQTLKGLQWFV